VHRRRMISLFPSIGDSKVANSLLLRLPERFRKMAYDGDFYRAYAHYLAEPRVRSVHDCVIGCISGHPAFGRVIDLGCGQGNEFLHHGHPAFYVGMDCNPLPIDRLGQGTVTGDYRADFERVVGLIRQHGIRAVVSLFSVECTGPAADNRLMYEELFRRTSIRAILSSGFYYSDRLGLETVGEAGGIISYQTFSDIEDRGSQMYAETQAAIPCPSDMFGATPVEVHCLLQRHDAFDAELAQRFAALSANPVPRRRDISGLPAMPRL